jgi:hypothetical protein
VPLAVARDLQRVDRINHAAGRDQRLHPRAAVGLDPDQHLVRLVSLAQVIRDQRVKPSQTGHPLWQATPRQHAPSASTTSTS